MSMLGAVDLTEGIEQAWEAVLVFVPKLVGFLLIILIGYLVAKFLTRLLDGVLERVGFDRWVERGGVRAALERSKYDASDIVSRVVFWALLLFVLQLAFGVWGPNPVSDLIHDVIAYLPRLFVAILIIVIASAIAAGVREIVQASIGGLSYGSALATLASVAILAIGVFAALNQLQIAPAIVNGLFYALLAIVAGSAIIAIGGAGIGPMRRKWEEALARYDAERPRLQREAEGAGDRVRARADELKDQVRAEAEVHRPGSTATRPMPPPEAGPQGGPTLGG
jgi:hypothetical protein